MKLRWRPKPNKTPRALEYDRIRRIVWPAVLRRSGHRCEGCGASNVTLSLAHLFGRPSTGAGLGPWAHCEHLVAPLCEVLDNGGPGCHRQIDRALSPTLARRLRAVALQRLALATVGEKPPFQGTLDEARQLVAELESLGWTYDAETQCPRKVA